MSCSTIVTRAARSRSEAEILTPEDGAQIQAADLDDILEPYNLHDWERDHEIEERGTPPTDSM
jgi:hypothetical protein